MTNIGRVAGLILVLMGPSLSARGEDQAAAPASLDVCTGIAEQSTAAAITATAALSMDSMEEAMKKAGEAGRLSKAAGECAKQVTNITPTQNERWQRAVAENVAQAQIFQAAMRAKK